jgi:hypothetical protein
MSEFIRAATTGTCKLWVWSPETIDDIQTKAELGRYTNRGPVPPPNPHLRPSPSSPAPFPGAARGLP